MRDRTIHSTLGFAAVVAIALLALFMASDGSANAAISSHRVGSAPGLPRGAHQVGRLASGTQIPVDITLNPRDPAALAAFVQGVSTPGNAAYHHYLTVAQFRQQFGPTDAQIATVRASLTSDGLNPSVVSANGLLIQVTASAAQLSAAFRTGFNDVQLPSGRTAFANTSAPQFSGKLTGLVQGVVGLNNLSVPHALGLERATPRRHIRAALRSASETAHAVGPTPCTAATDTGSDDDAYTADQISSAYGFNNLYAAGDTGAGQTVAIMEFESFSTNDIKAYNTCYGIDGGASTDVTTTRVTAGRQTGAGSGPGSGESALDIEQVLGLAPAADVDVYESPNTYAGDINGYTDMVDSAAEVISTSWGDCEQDSGSALEAESTIFEQAASEGISVYAAAGDDGSTDCYSGGPSDATPAVDDPGSQPDVTSVGGTSLPSDTDPAGQTVWNDSPISNGATGGGVSVQWAMPSYQANASSALGVINADSSISNCAANDTSTPGAYCREVPDVSANADPQDSYVVYYDGSWTAIGGTSAAAPLWAAMTALANASSACAASAVGFANPVLYAIADNATEYARDFTDITVGTNDYKPSGYFGGLYPATVGYDMASGLGAPNGATLIPDMCSQAAGMNGTTTTGTSTIATVPTGTTTTGTTTTGTTPTGTTTTGATTTTGTTTTGATTTTGTTTKGTTATTPPTVTTTPTPVTHIPAPITKTTPPEATTTVTITIALTAPSAGQTTVAVRLACPAQSTGCTISAALDAVETITRGRIVAVTAARRAAPKLKTVTRTVVLGTSRIRLGAGEKTKLTISLNAAGKVLLAKQKKLKLALHLTDGGKALSTRIVTFTVAKRKASGQGS